MKYVTWAAMAIVTLVMVMGGGAKLMGNEFAHKSFADLGLPGWFGYFIGACELAGGIGIWLRKTSMWAAAGVAAIMAGAVYYHYAFPPISAAVPALVVLACALFVVSRRGGGVIG